MRQSRDSLALARAVRCVRSALGGQCAIVTLAASPAPWPGSLTRRLVARPAALMSDVYEDHKDEDGFLYITYSGENTFGC